MLPWITVDETRTADGDALSPEALQDTPKAARRVRSLAPLWAVSRFPKPPSPELGPPLPGALPGA